MSRSLRHHSRILSLMTTAHAYAHVCVCAYLYCTADEMQALVASLDTSASWRVQATTHATCLPDRGRTHRSQGPVAQHARRLWSSPSQCSSPQSFAPARNHPPRGTAVRSRVTCLEMPGHRTRVCLKSYVHVYVYSTCT
jgi:hypothetical protein